MALGLALAIRWLMEVAGGPLTELDDAYSSPHPPDPYIDTLFGRAYIP